MHHPRQIRRILAALLLLSAVIRGFLAFYLEFGNDEVYYWTYALFPGMSHFDHPPMVGFLIQLTTFNLALESEFFIRLGAVLLGTFNTWLVYLIGRNIRDALTGLYAAMLYTASIYAFIISGTFILPDTPQLAFWLLTIYFLMYAVGDAEHPKRPGYILLAGLFAGLALLSKYTSVFLLAGTLLYMLAAGRKWLRVPALYAAALLALLFFIPVLLWNYQHDFISFTYQGGRVGIFDAGIRGDLFITELGGQIFYNNPVNFFLGIVAMIAFFRGRISSGRPKLLLLAWVSLPLILLFLFFSLFRHTLPHWTGPAWTSIILLSAVYIRERGLKKQRERLFPAVVTSSLAVLVVVLVLGLMQVRGGYLYTHTSSKPEKLGEKDVSLDMYGWRQLGMEFESIVEKEKELGNIDPKSPVISHRWFPAANIDHYLASPLDIEVLGIGSLDALHKYAWITNERGGFREGMDAWYITVSRDYRDPVPMYGPYFESIERAYTLPITRNGKHVMNAFVYYLKDMKKLPGDLLQK